MNIVADLFEQKRWNVSVVFMALIMVLLIPASALPVDDSGLKISLQTQNGNTLFTLNDAVTFMIQVKNDNQWPINAPRGFSQIELHRSLVITDPGGRKHILAQEEVATDMPPPLFWSGKETAPAEILDSNWERNVEIDLGKVFGMVNVRPGVYTVEARQPFTRFPWTIKDPSLGLMGIIGEQDEDGYWKGDVESENILKIIVVPVSGGRFNLQLVDLGLSLPVRQTQVRVYHAEDIPEGMSEKEIWDTQDPVIAGSTDFQGRAAWEGGHPCMPKGNYRAVGFYQEEYKAVDFEAGTEEWGNACEGLLSRSIYFNEPEPQMYEFSIFGFNSVHIQQKARVLSGDIGVQSEGKTITLDPWVKIKDGASIRGDSILIGEGARVWDVYYNNLINNGHVAGTMTDSISLPLWNGLQSLFPSDMNSGSVDRTIGYKETETLTPDVRYGDVSVGEFGKLKLVSGTYYFHNLTLDSHARLVCLGPTEIHVGGQFKVMGPANYVGPKLEKYLRPRDVMIYVAGNDDAVSIGKTSLVRANIFAMNGSMTTGAACWLAGAFYAPDITIGPMSVVSYDGYFRVSDTEGDPSGSGITLTVEKSSWWFYKLADLTWTGVNPASDVNVYRNGILIKEQTENDGEYTDNLGWRPSGIFNYMVCEAETENCSPVVSIEY